MKKEMKRSIVLLLICCAGGLLVGFNAGHLSQMLNAFLFALGVILLSGANSILILLEKMWQKGNK